MKLENQVCSATQAKRLKELGIAQKGLYYFYFGDTGNNRNRLLPLSPDMVHDDLCAVAFTCAELGMLLPSEIRTEREPGLEYSIWVCSDEMNYEVAFPADTEAAAKADMLIWLLEKSHESAEQCSRELANA